jgi:tetratricopeptide (TPR) repeat protein
LLGPLEEPELGQRRDETTRGALVQADPTSEVHDSELWGILVEREQQSTRFFQGGVAIRGWVEFHGRVVPKVWQIEVTGDFAAAATLLFVARAASSTTQVEEFIDGTADAPHQSTLKLWYAKRSDPLKRRNSLLAIALALPIALAARPWPSAAESNEQSPPTATPSGGTSPMPQASGDSALPAPASTSSGADRSLVPAETGSGRAELKLAKRYLDEGEAAQDEATQRRNYEVAKQHAERAVKLLPNEPDAHFVRFGAAGRLAQMGGLATAALALAELNRDLDEVLRLDPNHANALAARGGMMMKLPRLLGGNQQEGLRYLERAVELDQNAVGKRLELAEAYEIVGRKPEALAMAQEALEWAKRNDEPKKAARCERLIAELTRGSPSPTATP